MKFIVFVITSIALLIILIQKACAVIQGIPIRPYQ
jgi:hypothetical protein